MTQKARLLSGRVPVTGPTAVTSDRYQFLGLDQAEPNLGTATNGNVLTTNIYGVRTWSNAISLANLTVGNVTANTVTVSTGLFWANGVPFTAYGNTDVTGFLSSYTGNITAGNINTTGNVTASYILGNGSKLTGMNAYANIDVAGYLPTYTGNITANNVTVTSGFRGNIFADIITPYQTTITAFNSSTAIKLPVGDNSTRPTGVAGYLRYSTAGLAPEYYNGTTWVSVNNTVTSQTFSGDGTNVIYTLDQTTTQAGVLVSINGTLQQPGVAYTVSGTQITFAEIPLTTDVIDIRFLGSLVSALATYSNTNVTAYLAGNITTGNITSSGITANGVIRFTNNTNVSTLQITGTATRGGAGYHDFLSVTNQGGGTNPNKNFRINSTGGLEIIDSTYSNNLFTLTDAGVLTIKSTFTPGAYRVGEVIKTTMLYPSDMGISTDVSTTGGNIATYSYTPVSSSSYIIAEFGGRWEVNGATIDSWWSNLYVASTQVGVGHMNWDGTANGTLGRTGTFWPVQGRYTNSDTGIKAIYAQANRDSSDDSFIMRYNSNFGFWMKITEIGR